MQIRAYSKILERKRHSYSFKDTKGTKGFNYKEESIL